VAPASAVPLKFTLCALVAVATAAPSVLLTSATAEAVGAVASTVRSRVEEVSLVLPEVSVTVVVKLCGPSERPVAVVLHAPVSSAVVVATSVPWSYTRTVAPGAALPARSTARVLVTPPMALPSTGRRTAATADGATGVAVTGVAGSPLLPPSSVLPPESGLSGPVGMDASLFGRRSLGA